MGSFGYNANSIEGDVYIQRLASYIKKNEEALANGLLCFSKNPSKQHPVAIKPLRLTFTIHHLYFLLDKIEQSSLDVDVGPLNIKLDINPNHEPTFISFMANNARASKHFDSDTRSITSINSMKSMVSSASVYWRSFALSKDPNIIKKDLKYLYSSFTKIPCLILTPKTKVNSIIAYEEYPCDTSVPIKIFKNLQVLELVEYEPNEIFGWHVLSDQLRILIIRKSKINDMAQVLFTLVLEDENGRSSFNSTPGPNKQKAITTTTTTNTTTASTTASTTTTTTINHEHNGDLPMGLSESNDIFKRKKSIATNSSTGAGSSCDTNKTYSSLADQKWCMLKQLTISETSISRIPAYNFKPLVNLVKLNLSGNLLDEIPEGLDQLTNVKYLNFADNYITSLKNLPSDLKNLLTLNLNNNKITNLEGLENLASLEKIDLRRNQLPDLQALKPVITLFKNKPGKFNNIYLSNNKLGKNYRIEMFNLFNGVQYKNNVKIDDSRPGYFEKASLLDQAAATKLLQVFYKCSHKRENSESTLANDEEIATAAPTLVTNSPIPAINEDGIEIVASLKELKVDPVHAEPCPLPPSRQPSPALNKKTKKYELSRSISTTAPLALLTQPSSPLCANFNVANKPDAPSALKPVVTLNSSTSSISQPSALQRSSTIMDLENQNPAPNIVTPVQVTARMST
ncbi:uncharacterized protein LODBEIA_P19480 [Lodderomyces beijingensis]|uniref:Leucine-rich repeat-containing protein n=1 Tax=Lodderomyces beijingensis TaxID=1775926 RepID=A0ABP0ZHU6_9ASCO